MGISKHGKAGSEPESQDRQRLDVWDLSRVFIYPFSEFIHIQRHQRHQKSLQYILHKNWFVVLILPISDCNWNHP